MHGVFPVQELMGCGMEMLRGGLNRATATNDGDQGIERLLIERLMGLWCGHDKLEPQAVIETNDLVDVVGIEFLERFVHEQKRRLRRCLFGTSEMVVVGRRRRDPKTDVKRYELWPPLALPRRCSRSEILR